MGKGIVHKDYFTNNNDYWRIDISINIKRMAEISE
jgi:hypothetical protein